MKWLHKILKLIHWTLSAIPALLRRILHALWMPAAPRFLRGWPPTLSVAPQPVAITPPQQFDPIDAQGTFTGVIMRVAVPTAIIAPMLPRGVILPPEAAQAGYKHPVNLAFGFQKDVRPANLGWLPGCNYLEFVLGVSDVYLAEPHDGFRGPCAVLARLGLNQILPVILGRLLGLPKRLRRIHTTEDSFRVLGFLDDTLYVNGSVQPSGQTGLPKNLPGFDDIIRTFAQISVSRTAGGILMFTRFEWFWDQGIAQETGADVTVEHGWGDGHYVRQGDVSQNCSGAWIARVPWTMLAFQAPPPATPTAS